MRRCMKTILLSNGTGTLVDDEDFEELSQYAWSLTGKGYAQTQFTNRRIYPTKKSVHARMHRVIMWCPDGMLVDHIDGNKLNNQRNNLRIATNSENLRNRGKQTNNKSGYKGVSQHRGVRWTANITENGNHHYLGIFKTKEEAALAYNEGALKYHGKFAVLNKLPDVYN